MQANRRSDTVPEIAVRRQLHGMGLRFRKDYRVELGLGRANPRPDIAFTRAKVAVFVDGCFWHRCPEHGRIPGRNQRYWHDKFEANTARDQRNGEALVAAGWRVIRIWEHEDPVAAADDIAAIVTTS